MTYETTAFVITLGVFFGGATITSVIIVLCHWYGHRKEKKEMRRRILEREQRIKDEIEAYKTLAPRPYVPDNNRNHI